MTPITEGALARLRAAEPHLPPALQRIALSVLGQPAGAVYQSVTELAEQAGAGEASVIRLCRDLGFRGFQDFKLALAVDLAATGRPREDDNVVAEAVTQAHDVLEATRQVLSPEVLTQAALALMAAPRIEVTGQGASGVTALDFAYKLLRLGLPAQGHQDAHLAAMAAAVLPPGGVVIGVTRSGSTVDTVHALRLAQSAGRVAIAVTQHSRSPAAQAASWVLLSSGVEGPLAGGSISSKISQLLVLEALHLTLVRRLPGADAAIQATAEAVVDKSY